MKDPIKNATNQDLPAYVSWSTKNISQAAVAAMNGAVEEYECLSAGYSEVNNYSDLLNGISGRPGLTRSGYEAFRGGEKVPTKIEDILAASNRIYNKVGLIRNIIDLMADFACQGVRLSHPDKRLEAFYRNWFKKVNGKERSERFLNNLYKMANVIIRRQTAMVSLKDRNNLFKAAGAVDIKKIEEEKIRKREIPFRYTFLNPLTIKVLGGNLSSFTNVKVYAIQLPEHIKKTIKHASTKEEKDLIKKLPKEIIKAANTSGLVMLPVDKTLAFHYKKDDWQDWAIPMLYPIMDDIILLEKLKLADSAALDGAISNIRIFTIGDFEHKIVPSPVAAAKLKSVLKSHVGAGTIDIVWGPDLKMTESKTDVHKFLGQEKYIPTLNNIYGGIGIPPTLTGAFSTSGTTNNFISLKTLIQRLQYGRDVLMSFWEKEVEIIQKAMGFTEPASIEFDHPDLGDEATQNALLIQMSDRNLISDELLQARVKHNTRLEGARIAREHQERKDKGKPPKAGPFYEPQPELQLQRIALQSGQLTPDQVDLEFEGSPRDLPQVRLASKLTQQKTKQGIPQQGRPKNSPDTKKRKEKQFVPKTKAAVQIWASEAQDRIAEVMNPALLDSFGKKNMRSLTANEYKIAEKMKLGVLFNMEPFSTLSDKNIINTFQSTENVDAGIIQNVNHTINSVSVDLNRKLTMNELRQIYSDIYMETNYDN